MTWNPLSHERFTFKQYLKEKLQPIVYNGEEQAFSQSTESSFEKKETSVSVEPVYLEKTSQRTDFTALAFQNEGTDGGNYSESGGRL